MSMFLRHVIVCYFLFTNEKSYYHLFACIITYTQECSNQLYYVNNFWFL